MPGSARTVAAGAFTKEPSIIEQKAYRDTWGKGLDSYLEWFYETVVILRELLSETGSIYVHLDWHVGHYAKTVLDEVFGMDNFSATARITSSLNEVANDTGRVAFCGPYVLSAITGYPISKIERAINAYRELPPDLHHRVKGTYADEVEGALAVYGYDMTLKESYMHHEG